MLQKLANMEARALRRQADRWEQNPLRMLLISVGVQVVLQSVTREINRRAKKSPAPVKRERKIVIKETTPTEQEVQDIEKRLFN